jgi:DNA-binding transcriptional LysR family regulator
VRAALDAACAAAGFTPRIVFEASALPMVVELAGRGLGTGRRPGFDTERAWDSPHHRPAAQIPA